MTICALSSGPQDSGQGIPISVPLIGHDAGVPGFFWYGRIPRGAGAWDLLAVHSGGQPWRLPAGFHRHTHLAVCPLFLGLFGDSDSARDCDWLHPAKPCAAIWGPRRADALDLEDRLTVLPDPPDAKLSDVNGMDVVTAQIVIAEWRRPERLS